MTKPALKLCVLAISILSLLALGTRAAEAKQSPEGWTLDLIGVRLCVGEVEPADQCDIHVPANEQSEAQASDDLAPHLAELTGLTPLGVVACLGVGVSPPESCRIEMLGDAAMRGVHSALGEGGGDA